MPSQLCQGPWLGRAEEAGPCWHRTTRRHQQETDEPNQALLLFWNGGSKKFPQGLLLDKSTSTLEQIEKIEKLTRSLMEKQQIIWKELLNELKNSGICILSKHDLLTSDLKPLEKYFTEQLVALLSRNDL